MAWDSWGPSSPPCSGEPGYAGSGELLCHQPLPSSQGWDSSSACSRKSRPHFPPGASAQRDPLGRDRAFLRKRGVRVQGVGERVTKKKKKKIVAGPGMCLGESEPSVLSVHSCAGQGRVQGAGGAGSLSGQDTSCQPAPGGLMGSLPPACLGRS